MNFCLYSPFFLERFDHETPFTTGIGGSETAQIETSLRLAKLGHNVISYMPIPGKNYVAEGVSWRNCDEFSPKDVSKNTTYLIYRDSHFFDKNDIARRDQLYFVAQDCDYDWTPEGLAKVDKYLCLCSVHCQFTEKKYPVLKGRIHNFSNGIRRDKIEECLKLKIKKDPYKILYASSPDRGLELILSDWFRIKERCPKVQLTVAYGFENAEKILERGGNKTLRPLIDNLRELMKQKDIEWLGRINQNKLYKEWLSAGLWYYPTDWPETSAITALDAQACGAIPVTNSYWALKQNVLNGVLLDGIPQRDNVCRMGLLNELCNLLGDEKKQNTLRKNMREDALDSFDWNKWVKYLVELSNA